ncbi:phage tail length tape measure family protein [Microbulbifer sp. TRSA002]|uniref:phage tail length tape measure family protein n=1 Tax=Microbulbifer sp. TRSA002 TaxID=3243382 RepID=UPI0040397526
MAKQTSMATIVANLELRSTQYKREMDQATARNKKLTRELKSTSAAGDMFGRSMRGAAQGVAAIDGPLGGVSGRVGALNGLLTSGNLAWASFGVAIAGVTAVMYKSIRAGEEMERGQLKIEALLKATGSASGRTAEQLDEQARSVARATLASVTGIREAQGILLTFKGVQGPVFDDAIRLSQDMAAVMGGDAKNAALQLGKALEEPSTGITALKRAGVSFTAAEKEQIKTLEQSGRVAEAQRMILLKLEQQVGGAGAAEAGGLTGATDSLAQSWQEFLEGLSETAGSTGIATSGINKLTSAVDTLRRGLAPTDEEKQRTQFAELHNQYVWHQQMLAKAEAEGVQVQVEIHRNRSEMIRGQLAELQSEQIAAQKKRQDEERRAEEAAVAAREQSERDRIAQQRAIAEEAGTAQLIQLDQFLANQQGKIKLDHEQRLQQIAGLQIAEEELTRRGFESIEALRTEYAEREKERFQMALAEEQARTANGEGEEGQIGEDGLTEAERQRLIARLETLQLSWLTEMEQLQVQQDEEMALLDQAFASKLIAHDTYERRLTLLENKHRKQREKLEQASNKSRLQLFVTGANQVLSAAAAYNQKAAKAEMAMAVFSTGVSLVKNIAKASEIGYPQNIPMIAGAIGQGIQIAGMLSDLQAPSGVSGGAAAPSISTTGSAVESPGVSGIDEVVEGEAQQPVSQVIFQFMGDVVGDSSERIIEEIQTKMSEGELVLFDKSSRQALELNG